MKIKKYGGSSLKNIKCLKMVADDIKKDNTKQIVVVSAKEGYTNEIIKSAYEISKNPSKREIDQMIVTGEMINAALLTICLNEIGVKAVSLNSFNIPIISSKQHGMGLIKWINKDYLDNLLKEYDVLVITGFQGVNEREFISLSRGGSDTTALALCKIYGQECEIYTDVDGIYSVDPRMFSSKKMDNISYENMLNLAYNGGKVLSPNASLIAYNYKIPTKIIKTHTNSYTKIDDIEDYGVKAVSYKKCIKTTNTNDCFFIIDDEIKEGYLESLDGNLAFIFVIGSFLLKQKCDEKILDVLKNSKIDYEKLIMKDDLISFVVKIEDKEKIMRLIVKEFNL